MKPAKSEGKVTVLNTAAGAVVSNELKELLNTWPSNQPFGGKAPETIDPNFEFFDVKFGKTENGPNRNYDILMPGVYTLSWGKKVQITEAIARGLTVDTIKDQKGDIGIKVKNSNAENRYSYVVLNGKPFDDTDVAEQGTFGTVFTARPISVNNKGESKISEESSSILKLINILCLVDFSPVDSGSRQWQVRPEHVNLLLTEFFCNKEFCGSAAVGKVAQLKEGAIDKKSLYQYLPYVALITNNMGPSLQKLIDNGTIKKLHDDKKYEAITDIIRFTLRAFDQFHARGLLHRDPKPGNLSVDINSDFEVKDVKLIDFGSVAILKKGSKGTRLKEDELEGTTHYMAREASRSYSLSQSQSSSSFSSNAAVAFEQKMIARYVTSIPQPIKQKMQANGLQKFYIYEKASEYFSIAAIIAQICGADIFGKRNTVQNCDRPNHPYDFKSLENSDFLKTHPEIKELIIALGDMDPEKRIAGMNNYCKLPEPGKSSSSTSSSSSSTSLPTNGSGIHLVGMFAQPNQAQPTTSTSPIQVVTSPVETSKTSAQLKQYQVGTLASFR